MLNDTRPNYCKYYEQRSAVWFMVTSNTHSAILFHLFLHTPEYVGRGHFAVLGLDMRSVMNNMKGCMKYTILGSGVTRALNATGICENPMLSFFAALPWGLESCFPTDWHGNTNAEVWGGHHVLLAKRNGILEEASVRSSQILPTNIQEIHESCNQNRIVRRKPGLGLRS